MSRLHVRRSYLYHHVYLSEDQLALPRTVLLRELRLRAELQGRKDLFVHAPSGEIIYTAILTAEGWRERRDT